MHQQSVNENPRIPGQGDPRGARRARAAGRSRVQRRRGQASRRERLGGGTVVVKAQIHAGGRGKGGGVKVVKGPGRSGEKRADDMIGMRLVTHQTGPRARSSTRVLVEQGLAIKRELYLGIVLDRASEKPVLMVSQDGGVDIEKVAPRNAGADLTRSSSTPASG